MDVFRGKLIKTTVTHSEAQLVFLSRHPDATAADWAGVLPADVPAWAKDPEVVGRLVGGEEAQDPDTGRWYRAMRVEDPA